MKKVAAISTKDSFEFVVNINKHIKNGFELVGNPIQDKDGYWWQFFIKEYPNPGSFAAVCEESYTEVPEEQYLLEWMAKTKPVDTGNGMCLCNIGDQRIQLSYRALLSIYQSEKK